MACVPLSVTIVCNGELLKKNFIKVLPKTSRLGDVLRQFADSPAANIKRIAAARLDGKNEFECEEELTVGGLLELDNQLRHVTFHLQTSAPQPEPGSQAPKNAFDLLMSAARSVYLPPKKHGNAKCMLYNAVVEEMEAEKAFFPMTTPESDAGYIVQVITNALWYIDGNKKTIQDATERKKVNALPGRFIEKFNDFNDFKRKKQKCPSLSAECCKTHSEILFSVLGKPYTLGWGNFLKDLEQLALCLQSYSSYLTISNLKQKERQSQSFPCRKLSDNAFVEHRPRSFPVGDEYSLLDAYTKSMSNYEPFCLDESVHISTSLSKMQRHRFIKDLQLSVPVDLLRFDPGGGVGSLVFLWTVPVNRPIDEILTSGARMLQILQPQIPQYHTRQMRAEFMKQYSSLGTSISSSVLRSIYANLSLDSSTDKNPAIDERVREAILGEDCDLMFDLRHTNKGRPDNTFQDFFSVLEKRVEEITAADERRHGVAHFSEYISIRDLREQTMKDCPEGTPIPSESTISFSFMPKNMYTEASKRYTGRIGLMHKVQSRQLRQFHVDTHYCAALFKGMRQMAIALRPYTILLSIDDKAKVDIGEPGLAISTGVRGKKSLVPAKTLLGALDHDMQSKASLTPSVVLNVDIPNDITSSFYRGQVSVTLKDAVFQPSCAFRHAAEIKTEVLRTRELARANDRLEQSILMIYSDGGPDHRITYDSVKLSLVVLFKALNLDMLIAARTAPGNSWANPVERVMSLMNLGYQNCALERQRCPDEIEMLLKTCNSMEGIRTKVQKHPEIRESWVSSIKQPVTTLEERTRRLSLKDVPFITHCPATQDQIEGIKSFIPLIDPDLKEDHLQKKDTSKCKKFQEFLDTHCRSRNYSFQIRKCADESCCGAKMTPEDLHWLPDPVPDASGDHYKDFSELYGIPNDERYRPSLLDDTRRIAAEEQGCESSLFTAQRVRGVATCTNCLKPRCVFGKRKLTDRELSGLRRLQNRYHYICGANITPEGDVLQGVVFVNIKITCESPIELSYYSSSFAKDVCAYCGTTGADRDVEAKKLFKTVLPLCVDCKTKGRKIITRQPVANAKKLKL